MAQDPFNYDSATATQVCTRRGGGGPRAVDHCWNEQGTTSQDPSVARHACCRPVSPHLASPPCRRRPSVAPSPTRMATMPAGHSHQRHVLVSHRPGDDRQASRRNGTAEWPPSPPAPLAASSRTTMARVRLGSVDSRTGDGVLPHLLAVGLRHLVQRWVHAGDLRGGLQGPC
jgi:hypothetical protein